MNDTNITLLGPPIEHRDSLISMLAGRSERVVWIPNSTHFHSERRSKPRSRLQRIFDKIRGTRDSAYLSSIANEISRSKFLIAYWGTIPISDIIAIRAIKPDIKIVLMVLCYPLALRSFGITCQNMLLKWAKSSIDGYLFPSTEMADYFRCSELMRPTSSTIVIPPCWPLHYLSGERIQTSVEEPNLVFTGRTDLSGVTIHAGDDLRSLMKDILDSGIYLHHVYSPETDDKHPFRRPFAPKLLPDFIRSMNYFDASLIAYNTDACSRDDRFRITIPDRLITSVAAGLPIAIPRKGYEACKSYLKNYPVLDFEKVDELALKLNDRSRINDLQDAAWDARTKFVSNRFNKVFSQFLDEL